MIKQIKIVVGLLFISLACMQCEFNDPSENLTLSVDYNVIKNVVGLTFTDATTGSLLYFEDQEIQIIISGEDANLILDGTGELRSVYNEKIGALSLAIQPERVPSTSDPVRFSISVSTNGFVPIVQELEINQEGLSTFSIEMSRVTDLLAGKKGISEIFAPEKKEERRLYSDFVSSAKEVQTNSMRTKSGTEKMSVQFSGRCSLDYEVIVKPSYYGLKLNLTQMTYNWVELSQGTVMIEDLQQGDRFIVGVYYNSWYFTEITYEGQDTYIYDFVMPDELCNGF